MSDFCAIDPNPDGSPIKAAALGFVTASDPRVTLPPPTAQSVPTQTAPTPEENAANAKEAVRTATVKFGVWQRLKLKLWAWHTKRTGPEVWSPVYRASVGGILAVAAVICTMSVPIILLIPSGGLLLLLGLFFVLCMFLLLSGELYSGDFVGFFNTNAPRFGNKIKRCIPFDLKQRLEKIKDGNEEPFLVVKGVFSRRFPQYSLARKLADVPGRPTRKSVKEAAAKLIDKGYYDLVASGLIAATDTELRRKLDKDVPYRDFITETAAEISQFAEGTDMYLRYRTATPEMPPATAGDNTAARIIVFACIENPIADPIYLVRVDDVLNEMPDKKRNLLYDPDFNIFDKWNTPEVDTQPGPNPNKRILHRGVSNADWLTFDPNRICSIRSKDADHNAAIGALMEAIQDAVAKKKVREIVLRRGDALVVDNYRALTRRQEHGYAYLVFKPFMGERRRPPVRWLRIYYGFPKRPTDVAKPPTNAAKS